MALLVPQSHPSFIREKVVVTPALVDGSRDLGKHPRNIPVTGTNQLFSYGGLCVNHPLLTPGVSSKSQAALTVAGTCPPATGSAVDHGILTSLEIQAFFLFASKCFFLLLC